MLKRFGKILLVLAVSLVMFAGCNETPADNPEDKKDEVKTAELYVNGEKNADNSFSYTIEDAVPGLTSVTINVKAENVTDATDISVKNAGTFTVKRDSLIQTEKACSRDFTFTTGNISSAVSSGVTFEVKRKSGDNLKATLKLSVKTLKAEDSSFKVQDISFKDVKDTSVTATWTAPAGRTVSFYNIKVSAGDEVVNEYKNEVCESNSFKIEGLKQKTDYRVSITCFGTDSTNAAGYATASANVKTESDMTPPAVPSEFKIAASALNYVNLQWTNPTDADFENIKVYEVVDSVESLYKTLSKTENTLKLDFEASATPESRIFKLSSVDSSGNESKKTSALTVTPVAVPVISGITSEETELGQVKVSWTGITLIDSLTYLVKIYEAGVEMTGNSVNTNNTEAVFSSLNLNKEYKFTVSIYNDGTNTAVTTSALSGAITTGQISNITATTGVSGQAVVSWTGASGSNAYKYKIMTYKNGSLVTGKDVLSTKTRAAVSGLTVGTDYTFKVAICNASGSETYVTESCPSTVKIEYVLWNVKSAYSEMMVHSATLIDSYNGKLGASSDHIIASDHNDDTADDTGRTNFKYAYFIVMPGLADPSDPDLISLMACGGYKDCNVVLNPVLSGKYAYFDTSNSKTVPAGSARATWGGGSLETTNGRTNKMWIASKAEIGSANYANASFRIIQHTDITKETMSDEDNKYVTEAAEKGYTQVPRYKIYPNGNAWIYLKSESGLYWQHAYCIFRGNESATNDAQCAALSHFEFRYTSALDLSSY